MSPMEAPAAASNDDVVAAVNGWNESVEDFVRQWARRMRVNWYTYTRQALHSRRWYRVGVLASTCLGAGTALPPIASLLNDESHDVQVALGVTGIVLAAMVATATAVLGVLDFATTSEVCAKVARDNERLGRLIEFTLSQDRSQRRPGNEFVREITEMYDSAMQNAPVLYDHVDHAPAAPAPALDALARSQPGDRDLERALTLSPWLEYQMSRLDA